ncbi:hypothetical protein GVAV_001678 [Gurleya vavrai]
MINEALKLFSNNCKILFYVFEHYFTNKNLEKAEKILSILEKNHSNDPRTIVCIFMKESFKSNSDKHFLSEILLKAYNIDKKYWKVHFLLGNLFYNLDDEKSYFWFKKCLNHCSDEKISKEVAYNVIDLEIKLDEVVD